MSTIGSQAKAVFGRNATVKIGANTYALARNVNAEWSYAIDEDDVIGSAIPVHSTGAFRGTVEIEALVSTDLDFHDFVTPGSDGQVAESTITLEEQDTQAVGSPPAAEKKTWTILARLNTFRNVHRELGKITATVRGVLTAEPSESVA